MRPLLLILAALAMGADSRAQEGLSARFPLQRGLAWVYRGQVRWTDATNRVQIRELQWKARILAVRKPPGQVIARMEGWPGDLAWYAPGRGPGIYLLVQDASGLCLLEGEEAQRVWEGCLGNPKATIPAEDLAKGERLLPDRLREGLAWGDAEDLARPDGLYVRRVEEVGTQGLDGLGGWRGPARGTFFRITYRTNPDHTVVDFVPGLGFTRYTYAHHGTVSECDLRLVAVERGPGR